LAQRGKGRKKRKQRAPAQPPVAPVAGGAAEPRPPRASRTEAKNRAVRESLVPLGEGERPLAITIGAIAALALVVIQVPLYAVYDGAERPPLPGFLFFMVLMLVMAWGMWNGRYWAVLGFQALLALLILIVSLVAMLAADVLTLLICVAILIPAIVLFWFMVKAMARIQMPDRS
jgi:hypothetical protein